MEQKEMIEQINKLLADNPAKFIRIRDTFDEMFEGRVLKNSQDISDREYDRVRYKFRNIDIPLSWCADKESVYQLYKHINQHRDRNRGDDYSAVKKSKKNKKKGLLDIFK